MAARRTLVFLDCLLDTRLGTLAKIDTKYRDKILNEKTGYFERVIDEFDWLEPGLTERFKTEYAKRDIVTLRNSFRSRLVDHLMLLTASIILDGSNGPIWDEAVFEVNYWPYALSVDEVDMFAEVIQDALTGTKDDRVIFSPKVKMVSFSPSELTLGQIKSNWDCVYLYDFHEWVTAQADCFKDASNEMVAAQVELHVPTLFHSLIDKAELKLPEGGLINPFNETKRNMALWINLVFNHPRLFCIVDPLNPDI